MKGSYKKSSIDPSIDEWKVKFNKSMQDSKKFLSTSLVIKNKTDALKKYFNKILQETNTLDYYLKKDNLELAKEKTEAKTVATNPNLKELSIEDALNTRVNHLTLREYEGWKNKVKSIIEKYKNNISESIQQLTLKFQQAILKVSEATQPLRPGEHYTPDFTIEEIQQEKKLVTNFLTEKSLPQDLETYVKEKDRLLKILEDAQKFIANIPKDKDSYKILSGYLKSAERSFFARITTKIDLVFFSFFTTKKNGKRIEVLSKNNYLNNQEQKEVLGILNQCENILNNIIPLLKFIQEKELEYTNKQKSIKDVIILCYTNVCRDFFGTKNLGQDFDKKSTQESVLTMINLLNKHMNIDKIFDSILIIIGQLIDITRVLQKSSLIDGQSIKAIELFLEKIHRDIIDKSIKNKI